MANPASPVTSGSQLEEVLSREPAKETSLFWTLMTPVTFTGRMIKNAVVFTLVTAPSALFSVPGKLFSAIFGKTETTEEELPQIEELPAEVLAKTAQDTSEVEDQDAAKPKEPVASSWEARFNQTQPILAPAQQEEARQAAMARLLANKQPENAGRAPSAGREASWDRSTEQVIQDAKRAQLKRKEFIEKAENSAFTPVNREEVRGAEALLMNPVTPAKAKKRVYFADDTTLTQTQLSPELKAQLAERKAEIEAARKAAAQQSDGIMSRLFSVFNE